MTLGLPQSGRTDLVNSLASLSIHILNPTSNDTPRTVSLLKIDARILGHGCTSENVMFRHFVVTDMSQR